jgi:hypothetical protein
MGQALAEMLRYMADKRILEMRDDCEFRIAVALPPGTDPARYAEAGATWWLPAFDPATVSWTRCGACSATAPRHEPTGAEALADAAADAQH